MQQEPNLSELTEALELELLRQELEDLSTTSPEALIREEFEVPINELLKTVNTCMKLLKENGISPELAVSLSEVSTELSSIISATKEK